MTELRKRAMPQKNVPGWRRYGLACAVLAGTAIVAAFVLFTPESSADVLRVRKVAEFPHDRRAFTQGLVVHQSRLFEGTGRYQESSLREVDLVTGNVTRNVPLAGNIFGEGITVWKDQLIQLTWQNGHLIVWQLDSMQQQSTVSYQRIDRSLRQGWGITHNGQHVIISDGTSVLRFVDPKTWQTVRRIRVRQGNRAVGQLNELEYVNGEILANVWYSTRIARIDPQSGSITGWLELEHLFPATVRHNREAVLNGIAWDADRQRLFVTGKLWPSLYEITYDGLPTQRPAD